MVKNPFISKEFKGRDIGGDRSSIPSEVDQWLNSLVAPGFGMSVVGYVAIGPTVIITVKLWQLGELKVARPYDAPAAPTTIDEEWQPPTVQVGADNDEDHG